MITENIGLFTAIYHHILIVPLLGSRVIYKVHEEQWLAKEFTEALQARYTSETEKKRHTPSFSHAAAVNTLMKHWWFGSPDNQLITLGVPSEGSITRVIS